MYRISTDDLSDFYYTFKVSEARSHRNATVFEEFKQHDYLL